MDSDDGSLCWSLPISLTTATRKKKKKIWGLKMSKTKGSSVQGGVKSAQAKKAEKEQEGIE
jgi:hypothetical protein